MPIQRLDEWYTSASQGANTSDLTRAIKFALENKKLDGNGQASDYMFPDDIHTTHKRIQYTKIMFDHTDRAIVKRYNRAIKEAIFAKQRCRRGNHETQISVPFKR